MIELDRQGRKYFLVKKDRPNRNPDMPQYDYHYLFTVRGSDRVFEVKNRQKTRNLYEKIRYCIQPARS